MTSRPPLMVRMARNAERWELVFFAVFAALLAATLGYAVIGLPRVLAGLMSVILLLMALGALFIIDNIRNRAG